MKGGYMGYILRIDLTRGKTFREKLDKTLIRNYIGGSGFAVRILYDEVAPETDPLSPGNKLFIGTGPLTGTLWPSSGRFMFATKSPLTGIWGESHVGGQFGPEIKYCGYDAVIIEGRASKPVYILLYDGDVEIRDASQVWGLNTHDAADSLKDMVGNRDAAVACIGPAGEKMVRYANVIVSYGDAAGRTGIGAVMGSKNLKAIVAKGYREVKVYDPERFIELAKEAHRRIKEHPQAQQLARYGTPLLVSVKQTIGELPTKNHWTGVFSEFEKICEETIYKNYFVAKKGCFGCTVMCKKFNDRVESGPYKGVATQGPEYETVMAFGSNILNSNFPFILQCNLLCNQLGLDTISAGGVIAYVMELYENGIINASDLDGVKAEWGSEEAVLTLLEKIARREGIGDKLAMGVRWLSEEYWKGTERYAMHVKGMEISGQDGRTHRSIGLSHATAARGADHLRSLVTIDQLGYEEVAAERFGRDKLPEICDPKSETYKALAVKVTEDVYALRDALIVCWYTVSWPPIFWVEDFARILPVATGIEEFGSVEELMLIGERQVNMKRAFNERLGITRKDDTLPERFTKEPMPEGPGKGETVDLDRMLNEYYELRGWDLETGLIREETLRRLGLADVLEDLRSRNLVPG